MAKEVRQDNIDDSQVPQAPQKERGRLRDFFGGSRRRRRQAEIALQAQKIADEVAAREARKAVGDESWRLIGIEVTDRKGESKKGWNSTVDEHGHDKKLVGETIDSEQTPFKPVILLVDPRKIGTHEDVTEEGLASIDFSKGWDGPAIAVAPVIDSEGQKNGLFEKLYKAVTANGGTGILDDINYGDLVVLDGHHRREVAATTQPLSYVPVQLIPYGSDPSVVLDTWHSDGKVWTEAEIYACARDPKLYADAKRTKFGITGNDGITRRILNATPNVRVPRQNLA